MTEARTCGNSLSPNYPLADKVLQLKSLPYTNNRPGPLFININNNSIVKGENGEPDGKIWQSPYSKKSNAQKKSAFIAIPKKFGQKVLTEVGLASFVVWLSAFDAFRIRKMKPFRLNSKITDEWGINRCRLTIYLTQLKSKGYLDFQTGKGKAPLILSVNGYQN